ncbi:hypothetical protein [Roseibium sp.]|uniref:hypothetical protein n=1 Tax=Roseibium sp. TaxID=1936156 RepID=UPI003A974EB2
MLKVFLRAAGILALGCLTMGAGKIDSAYTKIKLEECRQLTIPSEEGTDGGSWQCSGYQGRPVWIAEGDLRMFVSFGNDPQNEPAASQTMPNLNTVNETLEWRLKDRLPFATILRWFLDDPEGGKPGNVLVVTQLVPGATCQIAWIDARANKNANVLAREAADRLAGSYDCSQMPQIVGKRGKAF